MKENKAIKEFEEIGFWNMEMVKISEMKGGIENGKNN